MIFIYFFSKFKYLIFKMENKNSIKYIKNPSKEVQFIVQNNDL